MKKISSKHRETLPKYRNKVAQGLHEERDGAYKIRIVESKKRQREKLRVLDVLNLDEEELDELE